MNCSPLEGRIKIPIFETYQIGNGNATGWDCDSKIPVNFQIRDSSGRSDAKRLMSKAKSKSKKYLTSKAGESRFQNPLKVQF